VFCSQCQCSHTKGLSKRSLILCRCLLLFLEVISCGYAHHPPVTGLRSGPWWSSRSEMRDPRGSHSHDTRNASFLSLPPLDLSALLFILTSTHCRWPRLGQLDTWNPGMPSSPQSLSPLPSHCTSHGQSRIRLSFGNREMRIWECPHFRLPQLQPNHRHISRHIARHSHLHGLQPV
jgi:hypothetical protein